MVVNEFNLRIANVNGTGSASANGLIAKAIFRMGVPIGPKNIFPSNIQGMPTWYEIRVSEQGYTARTGGVDFMCAFNGTSFLNDMKEVSPGGYFLYDSTVSPRKDQLRDDIHLLELPVTQIARTALEVSTKRLLLQNLIYVGFVVSVLKIDRDVVEGLIKELYAKNTKLIPLNLKAFEAGYSYAQENYPDTVALKVSPLELTQDKILVDGNYALALGSLYAGATVAGWYPITPSTSVIDAFESLCMKYRVNSDGTNNFAIIQAEDEIAAMGIVLGASWNGSRAFTATSGPGVSLMTEFLGYAYYAEIPAVLFNIQRCGPSTGMPTRNQQADLLCCAYASHGDTKHILLFPSDPNECFEFALKSFDFADRFQTPVIVMSDLEIGMNEFVCDGFALPEGYQHDSGKLLRANDLEKNEQKYYRYLDKDGDGIPYRTIPGDSPKGVYFTRGSGHDKYGRYTENSAAYQENLERIVKKFETAASELPKPVFKNKSNKVVVLYFGSSAEAVEEALDILGGSLSSLRVRSFPFCKELENMLSQHEHVVVIEQNRGGQMSKMLQIELGVSAQKISSILFYDGVPIQARSLARQLQDFL